MGLLAASPIKRCTEIFEQVKTEKLGDAAPFFAINTRGALRHDCWIITIYALEQKDPGDFSAPTLYFAKEWYAAHDDEPQLSPESSGTIELVTPVTPGTAASSCSMRAYNAFARRVS